METPLSLSLVADAVAAVAVVAVADPLGGRGLDLDLDLQFTADETVGELIFPPSGRGALAAIAAAAAVLAAANKWQQHTGCSPLPTPSTRTSARGTRGR